MAKRITILGSTGSIGTQTLDVIAAHPEQFQVEGLAAGTNIDLLIKQVNQFRPKQVSVSTRELARELRATVSSNIKIYYGMDGLIELATAPSTDYVVTALTGSQGLRPTMAAIEAEKQIGLANKETLVTAGHIVTAKAREKGVCLLPIDSEHSAIYQCLNGEPPEMIRSLILTASGGAFRDLNRDQLQGVTVEQALAHPNWSMGAKITIDSATMANKGLEVIEAHWLFSMPYDRIKVLMHPQSIIHSMVEFVDNSIMAQLGVPDMRTPIQYALSYPQRLKASSEPLDLERFTSLDFRPLDLTRFPCLKMAYECGRLGGSAPTVYNAANEMAVQRFMDGEITFLQIEDTIEYVLERHDHVADPCLDEVEQIDRWARNTACHLT